MIGSDKPLTRATIRWVRVDQPGDEVASLEQFARGWRLAGVCTFRDGQVSCRLEYEIWCDAEWLTRSCSVSGHAGSREVNIRIMADESRRWRLGDAYCPAVEGCHDIDLNFSPSTNLLPIRRLNLAIGQKADVVAAWLCFPGFTLEQLQQSYTRLSENQYRYESANGTFMRPLTTNANGFVVDYPGFWVQA